MNIHEPRENNYLDMQNPMQDIPQLSTPKIISCI